MEPYLQSVSRLGVKIANNNSRFLFLKIIDWRLIMIKANKKPPKIHKEDLLYTVKTYPFVSNLFSFRKSASKRTIFYKTISQFYNTLNSKIPSSIEHNQNNQRAISCVL